MRVYSCQIPLCKQLHNLLNCSAMTLSCVITLCMMQIAKMDVRQQHQQQQQLVISSDSSYIRVILIKCINVTLIILALFFILISTVSLLVSHVTSTR